MARKRRFQGRRIDSACLRWAFCSAKHGWNSFLTLNSFPAHIRDFKNLKGIWHQMLARCHQLQSIFRLLKPFLHVQIWSQSVAVFQNHGVFLPSDLFSRSKHGRLKHTSCVLQPPPAADSRPHPALGTPGHFPEKGPLSSQQLHHHFVRKN